MNRLVRLVFAVLPLAATVALCLPVSAVADSVPTTGPGSTADSATQAAGFGTPSASRSVYGDVTEVGNGVLRCPVTGEASFLLASPQACRGATQRQPVFQMPLFVWGANNGYDMHLAGTATSTVFDASSATLTVPAGTSVVYAQLDWGGNTGGYQGANSLYCTSPLHLLKQPAALPPAPAAADAKDQRVNIAVGADPALTVPLTAGHFSSSQSQQAPAGMYSDWADVTSALSDVAGGASTTVTVGNVWTPTGYGCAAGWSLTVVYGTPQPTAAFPTLRQVDVYAGHLRGDLGADDTLRLAEPSATPATAHLELGVTAYDGDWNNTSDSVLVDGTPVDDPCGVSADGRHDNFFTSCADGALDPLDPTAPIPNNLSVDAKTFVPAITAADSGTVDVEVRPGADLILLQGLVVAEDIHPTFTAAATVPARGLHQGSTLTFTVSGTNTGDVPLTDLTVTDQDGAICTPESVASVPVGEDYSFACRITNVQTTVSDQLVVSATWPHDDLGLRAQVTVPLSVPVGGPQLAISQSASPDSVRSGDTVTLTVTVTNQGAQGDGDLTGITVTEPQLHGCTLGSIADLAAAGSQQLSCHFAPTAPVAAAVGQATATDVNGAKLSATSNPVAISVTHPELTITVVPDSPQVAPGTRTDFTVTVHNTGDVPLDVQVSNDPATDCDFTASDLAADAARGQECTLAAGAVGSTLSDTATFSATPEVTSGSAEPIAGHATGSAAVTTTATGSDSGGANGPGVGGTPLSGNGSGGSGTSGGARGTSGNGDAAGATPKQLAWTGVDVTAPVAVGLALLGGGSALLVLTRRRRRRHS